MFGNKCHQAVITFNQVRPDVIAIVVPVYVITPEQCIGAMMGQHGQNDMIVSQEKDCCQRKSFLAALITLLKKLGALKQFHIQHLRPGMPRPLIDRQFPCFGNKIRSQIFNGYIRIYEISRGNDFLYLSLLPLCSVESNPKCQHSKQTTVVF